MIAEITHYRMHCDCCGAVHIPIKSEAELCLVEAKRDGWQRLRDRFGRLTDYCPGCVKAGEHEVTRPLWQFSNY